MRKDRLALGIIILFIGVIVFSMSSQVEETRETQRVGDVERNLPYGEWLIERPFEKGDELFVAFRGPKLEGVPDHQVPPTVWVNITDPNDGNVTFRLSFRINIITRSPELNVTLESRSDGLVVDDSDLGDFNDSPEDVGGVAGYDGNYTAYVYTFGVEMAGYYYEDAILPFLEFWKIVVQRDYPNRNILPVASALIVGGVLFSIWAARSSQYSGPRRKHGEK